MKLIIDIPDYNLTEVQNGSIASKMILEAVKEGTPLKDNHEYKCEGCIHKDKCVRVRAFLMSNVYPYSDGCECFEKDGFEQGFAIPVGNNGCIPV